MKGKLILADGTLIEGTSFGYENSVSGEVVFNTGMTGYPESLTDPSYKGQILVMSYPLIGNYGVPGKNINEFGIIENFESSEIQVSALIIADYSEGYNHWSAAKSLGKWLKENKVPALFGVDTRFLTKKLRDRGVMLGKIEFNDTVLISDPNKLNLVDKVSTKEVKEYGNGPCKIVLVDCGVKNNIIMNLLKRGVKVILVPWNYDFLSLSFDGILISNGPGDPRIDQLKVLVNRINQAMAHNKPVFGICFGNQILALAAGGSIYKLKYGHRSQNQPCIDKFTHQCFITSQNHGYAVNVNSLPDEWDEWFVNANDGTNEGIRHKEKPFFSCQFHPEGHSGPEDTNYLFDEFIEKCKKY